MKKFFIIVICAAIAAIVGYGIKYIVTPINAQPLEYMTYENLTRTNGFIIRDEWLLQTRSAGTVYHSAQEGARVAKDNVIGLFFYGNVNEDQIKELAVVDNKLEKAQASAEGTSTQFDESDVESYIYKRETDIIKAAADNDIYSISKYKNDINSLRANHELSGENDVEELQSKRNNIIGSVGFNKQDISAQISGVFTTYYDGYESQLVPADIDSYDVNYFESLSTEVQIKKIENHVDVGEPICKIVNNHVWYVMAEVPAEKMKNHKKGDRVKVRFHNMSGAVVSGSINSVSEEQDGKRVITVKCSTYLESAFSYRTVDVDIIFDSYDGYRIPIHAVRTDVPGKQKVIGIKGSNQYDCDCDVLYSDTDNGYAIVESTENAENKISQMDRILVGER